MNQPEESLKVIDEGLKLNSNNYKLINLKEEALIKK